MKSAKVVIGANFGDEAKGLITDFLSARHNGEALVVRFNGGAQASHTVATSAGQRHAFSHFGSGSFAGASTFLSRFFVCNPLLFKKEHDKLRTLDVAPAVYIDTRSPVTTPYDMMINQMAEEARGSGRHGSCGVGFGETVERHQHEAYRIFYADLADTDRLKKKLQSIQVEWLPRRLKALGLEAISAVWQERIASAGILQKYLDDASFMTCTARGADASFLRNTDKPVIFEGAQGLLLDQGHAWFPYVTRSHTGLHNVRILVEETDIGQLDVHYVTRAYFTRHGAGPLPGELPGLPYPNIKDKTNIPNEFQGSLRFAWLDVDLLAATIQHDMQSHAGALTIRQGLAVSCMDQIEGDATFMHKGALQKTDKQQFLRTLQEATRSAFILASYGPTRNDISGG